MSSEVNEMQYIKTPDGTETLVADNPALFKYKKCFQYIIKMNHRQPCFFLNIGEPQSESAL